jgi:MFS family permease
VSAAIIAVMPLLAAVFILICGNGIITTLVPLRATLEGFSQAEIGFIGSLYFGGMLAGTWMAPGIVRRAGHIRAFAAYAALAAVAVLAMAMVVHPLVWAVLRGVIGFSFAGLYGVIEGWVSSKSDSSNRGRMLAIYNVVHFMGSATGQQALRFADPMGFVLFSAAACFLMLSLLPMSLTRAEPPPLPPKGRLEIRGVFRATPIGAVGIVLVGWANGAFWSLVPAFVERLALGPGTVATFMTFVILGSAIAPYPVGRLSDLSDRRWMIAAVGLATGLVEALIVASGHPPAWMLYAFGLGLGLTIPAIYPIVVAHTVDRMGSEKAVAISSTLLFLYCLGAIIGPMTASALIIRFGDIMLFVHNGVAHGCLVAFVVWRILRRPPAPRVPLPEDADATPPKGV